MISRPDGLLVQLVVGVALAVVTAQVLLLPWQGPLQQESWRLAAAAILLTGGWWLVNGALEGPVLLVVTSSHGFTLADVLGVPALLGGLVVLVRLALR